MTELTLSIPDVFLPLYNTKKRFIVIAGGRGSAKSWSVADFLLLRGYQRACRILCTREIQNSIKDSVYRLLVDRIEFLGLAGFYAVQHDCILGLNGTRFIFKGLRHNASEIKSTEGIDFCWVEEAQNVSRQSLKMLTPTIRKPGSQLIFTYNPTEDTDPVHSDFYLADRPDTEKIFAIYKHNPFFPTVLRGELEHDRAADYDLYLHKWEGQCVAHSDAQVFFGKWEILDFDTEEIEIFPVRPELHGSRDHLVQGPRFLFGADWGTKDPTALVRCFVQTQDGKKYLYIDYDAGGSDIDIEDLSTIFDQVPGSRDHVITADTRIDLISYMNRQGFTIAAARKASGSILAGITKIRGFDRIYIHPRCKNVIHEFRWYRWKQNAQTGEILNLPEDKHNHWIDALRYALEDLSNDAVVLRY
jgi:phage terminase large subunit